MEPDRLRRQNRPCSPWPAGACRPRCLHPHGLARRSPVAHPEGLGVSARLEPGSRGAGSPRSSPTSDPYRRSAPPHLAPLSHGCAPCQARRREPGRCGAGGESWRAHRGVNPLERATSSLSAPDTRVRRSGYASRKAERWRTPPASPGPAAVKPATRTREARPPPALKTLNQHYTLGYFQALPSAVTMS